MKSALIILATVLLSAFVSAAPAPMTNDAPSDDKSAAFPPIGLIIQDLDAIPEIKSVECPSATDLVSITFDTKEHACDIMTAWNRVGGLTLRINTEKYPSCKAKGNDIVRPLTSPFVALLGGKGNIIQAHTRIVDLHPTPVPPIGLIIQDLDYFPQITDVKCASANDVVSIFFTNKFAARGQMNVWNLIGGLALRINMDKYPSCKAKGNLVVRALTSKFVPLLGGQGNIIQAHARIVDLRP